MTTTAQSIGSWVDNDTDDDSPVVTKIVRLSRNDREGRAALKNVLRWHGPDDIHVEVKGKRVAHPGARALTSLRTSDSVRSDQLANASEYLDLLDDWCHDQIAEFEPQIGSHEDVGLGSVGVMAGVIVESRRECQADIVEARAVLARLWEAVGS